MPVIPLRYRDSDIAPIKAYASAQDIPLSTAIKQLAKLGLSTVEDGATLHDQAHRLQNNLQWTIEALMILRLQCTDKAILSRAQAAAVEFYKKHAERT
jgi:hypothetical protein